MNETKKFTFSTVTFAELSRLFELTEEVDDSKFLGWISDKPSLDAEDLAFLENLAVRNRKNIDAYSEEEVKAKLIIPILNRIDFTVNGFTDWYERPLKTNIGGVELSGTADYLIARGEKEPTQPVFFLQEFKPAFTNKSPEVQLVAEMLASLNDETAANDSSVRGAYVTGSIWKFVLMERAGSRFTYYVSQSLDCVRLSDAAVIYSALLSLKQSLTHLSFEQ